MKNMERGLAGLVVFRLAPVLLSLDGTSGCLLTGAWTAKLCVSDIVRGAICEALTHRFVKGLLPWLDWMHEAISMAVARSLGSSQSAVRPTSDECDEESSDRGSETPGGGAPSRVQLVGLYADIRYCKVVSLKYMKQNMQLAILQTRCTILLNPVLATLGQPSQRRSTAATKAIWSQDWVTGVWKQQVRADVLVTNPRPTQTLCKIDEWIMGFSFSRQV